MRRALLISLAAASLTGCSTISSTWNSWFGSEKDGTPDGPKLHSIMIDPRDPQHPQGRRDRRRGLRRCRDGRNRPTRWGVFGGVTTLKWALLALFVLNFSWIALSFTGAIVWRRSCFC